MEKTKKSIIVKGVIRDKMQLCRIAASQAKQMFRVVGNVDVIDLGSFNSLIDGYVVIVEFEGVKNREDVVEQPVSIH